MVYKTIKAALKAANGQNWPTNVPTQIIQTNSGYKLRVGTYADECTTLKWSPTGYEISKDEEE